MSRIRYSDDEIVALLWLFKQSNYTPEVPVEYLLTIKTENLEMNSQKATLDEKSNIIELFSQVKIIKGKEIIYGDYGFFDTNNKSYKVKSKNSSKVKVIISDSNE